MGIQYKHYFGCMKQLRSSDVEKNQGPRTSRRSFRVVYANIRSFPKNLSDLFLAA